MSAGTVQTGRTAALVVLGGMVAALHLGKLPPALPALQADLGISLVPEVSRICQISSP